MIGPTVPASKVHRLDRAFYIFPNDEALSCEGSRTPAWARNPGPETIGADGSGKSTLPHVLCGTLVPQV